MLILYRESGLVKAITELIVFKAPFGIMFDCVDLDRMALCYCTARMGVITVITVIAILLYGFGFIFIRKRQHRMGFIMGARIRIWSVPPRARRRR